MTHALQLGPDMRLVPKVANRGEAVVSRPQWQRGLTLRLVKLDGALAALAGVVALGGRFGNSWTAPYLLLTAAFPLGLVGMIAACRGYERRFLGSGSEEFRRVTDAAVRYTALVAVLAYGFQYELARGYVLIAFPLAAVLVLAGRGAARQSLHRARCQGHYSHRVLVLGRERSAAEMVRRFKAEERAGFNVVGACIDGSAVAAVEGVPVLGSASGDILNAVRRSGADTVAVAAWSALSQDDLRRLSWQLEGSGVSLVVAPSFAGVAGTRLHIRPIAGLPLLHVEQPEFKGVRRILKGAFDRLVAGTAILLSCPILLLIALAVRLDSPGPALFHQVRVGRSGNTFRMLKFRSMRVDAEQELATLAACNESSGGVLFKMRQDPRVTPLGRWLRRYSLDELPQLLNVVRGHMSLVGPRPPLPSEVAVYASEVHRRLLVKPGLTGLWQVSGRANLSWDESVRLDLHYVENWSLALDIAILCRTAAAVLKREGAY